MNFEHELTVPAAEAPALDPAMERAMFFMELELAELEAVVPRAVRPAPLDADAVAY